MAPEAQELIVGTQHPGVRPARPVNVVTSRAFDLTVSRGAVPREGGEPEWRSVCHTALPMALRTVRIVEVVFKADLQAAVPKQGTDVRHRGVMAVNALTVRSRIAGSGPILERQPGERRVPAMAGNVVTEAGPVPRLVRSGDAVDQ